jgi:RimJ/RimL family protein N-acetyltransferase
VADSGVLIEGHGVTIRRMRDDLSDYALLLRWRSAPHVAEWWDTASTELGLDGVMAKYGPRTRSEDPTIACIIEAAGAAIGYIQFYPWAAYQAEMHEIGFELPAGYWGVDIFIGERDQLDRGTGSHAVSLIHRYLIDMCSAVGVALVVARDNVRAQRAYEKAGLVRVCEVLDTDTRGGQRIPSYLMASPPRSESPHPDPPPRAGEGKSSPPP